MLELSPDGTRLLVSKHTYMPVSGSWEALGYWNLATRASTWVPSRSAKHYSSWWSGGWSADGRAMLLIRNTSKANLSGVYVATGSGSGAKRIRASVDAAEWWPER